MQKNNLEVVEFTKRLLDTYQGVCQCKYYKIFTFFGVFVCDNTANRFCNVQPNDVLLVASRICRIKRNENQIDMLLSQYFNRKIAENKYKK